MQVLIMFVENRPRKVTATLPLPINNESEIGIYFPSAISEADPGNHLFFGTCIAGLGDFATRCLCW